MTSTERICSITVWRPSLIQRPWKKTTCLMRSTTTSHRHHRKRLQTSHLIDDLLALSHPLPLGGLNILTWTPLINLWGRLTHLGLRQACNRSADLRTFQGQEGAESHERHNLGQMEA